MSIPACPCCQKQPTLERCSPWPPNLGPAPWHIGCYNWHNPYHYVGSTGWTKAEALEEWRRLVSEYAE